MLFGEEGCVFFQELVLYLELTYALLGLAQLAVLGLWARRGALRPLALQHPVVDRLVVESELLGHLGDRPAGGDHVVGGLAPELVGVLVVAHALPRFLGCLSIYNSWILNLGRPCPKKRYRSLADSELRYPYEGSKTLMHVFDRFEEMALVLELLDCMYAELPEKKPVKAKRER